MAMFKGTNYVGEAKMGFGGFFKDSSQPKSGFGKATGAVTNTPSGGNKSASLKKNSQWGQKWTPTCKECGGKF